MMPGTMFTGSVRSLSRVSPRADPVHSVATRMKYRRECGLENCGSDWKCWNFGSLTSTSTTSMSLELSKGSEDLNSLAGYKIRLMDVGASQQHAVGYACSTLRRPNTGTVRTRADRKRTRSESPGFRVAVVPMWACKASARENIKATCERRVQRTAKFLAPRM